MRKKYIMMASFIWIIIGFLFISKSPIFNFSRDKMNYIVLMISYFYIPFIYAVFAIKRDIDIFEPINIFFVIWFLTYTVTPIVLILQNNTLCQGVDVMDGCFKATIIYMISFTTLCISYFYKFKTNNKNIGIECNMKQIYKINMNQFSINQVHNITIIAVIGWGICYLISLYYLKATGRGFSYILTLGMVGNKTESSEMSLGFLENFSYCMIGFWLYICLFSKSRILKFVLAFLTATAYMIRGFRFVVIIMLISFIIMKYTTENKRPKIHQLILLLLLMLVFIGFLGFIRNDLRAGTTSDLSNFGLDEITYALYTNFNIYQIYYGLVNSLPSKHSFGGFQIFIDSLSVFIPRIIWHSKPLAADHLSMKLMALSVNDFAIYHAAMATPDLGGYYMQFGTLGCIAYMIAWGKFCGCAKQKFYNKSYDIHVLISYSIFVPSLLQTIIRGGDLFNIIRKIGFFFIPILCMKLFEKFGLWRVDNRNNEKK